MKKLFWGIAAVAVALAGCGESEEERFNKAKEKFDNFTVTIDFNNQGEENIRNQLEIDGKACKSTQSNESTTVTYYYKETDGGLYYYVNKINGWEKTPLSSVKELLSREMTGYVAYFQEFFYDDFVKQDGYLVMTDSALLGYDKMLGSSMTLSSAKLKLNGSSFENAVAVIQEGSLRTQINYEFEKFGSTSVVLPE